jgi:hypothetical protein
MGIEMERRNAEMMRLLTTVHRFLKNLVHEATHLRAGVADENRDRPQHLLLPSALVRAAEKVFQFIYTSSHAVRYLQSQIVETNPDTKISSIQLQANINLVNHFGAAAERAFSNAQNELVLMARIGSTDGTSVVQYKSASPESTVLFAIMGLINRPLIGGYSVESLYRNHLSSLVSIMSRLQL